MLVPSLTTPSSAQPASIAASARHRIAMGWFQYEPGAAEREQLSAPDAKSAAAANCHTRRQGMRCGDRRGAALRLVLELRVDDVVLATGGATGAAAAAATTLWPAARRVTARRTAGLLVHGLGQLVRGALQLLEPGAQRVRLLGVL